MRAGRAVRDALSGHPLARHIDDFLTDLANANKPRNTIRAYRGDLTGFAAHHDGAIAGQAPATPRRKRAAVASSCKWAVRHELLETSLGGADPDDARRAGSGRWDLRPATGASGAGDGPVLRVTSRKPA